MDHFAELRPAHGIHVFALEDGAVLYASRDQELHGLNPAAALLWLTLEAGGCERELTAALGRCGLDAESARRGVERQVAEWQRRGWLARAAAPPQPEPDLREGRSRREGPAAQAPAPVVPSTACVRHYRLLGTRFAIAGPQGVVDARLAPVLAHLECDAAERPDVVLEIRTAKGCFVLVEAGRIAQRGLAASELAPVVKLRLRNATMDRHDYFMQLHAGAVLGRRGALLLPGASGSGKSTLTAALVAEGFGYLSDEVVLLERETLGVRPFPLALTVKPGAVKPLSGLYPLLPTLDVHRREDAKRVRYLPPPRTAIAPDPAGGHAVRALVFPRYAPDAPTSLRPLGRREALERLVGSCLSLPAWLSARSVGDLVQWLREIEPWELGMRSVPEAVAAVRQRFEAP